MNDNDSMSDLQFLRDPLMRGHGYHTRTPETMPVVMILCLYEPIEKNLWNLITLGRIGFQ